MELLKGNSVQRLKQLMQMSYRGYRYGYCLGRYQYGIKSFATEAELFAFIDDIIDNPVKLRVV